MNTKAKNQRNRLIQSSAIALTSLVLATAPVPGLQRKIIVVTGTELTESMQQIEKQFEEKNPGIDVEFKFQGSQDIVNNVVDKKNDFEPTVLIPASEEMLTELKQRLAAQNSPEPFYETPQPIAKTFLVGIAWPERGKVLFPDGHFSWGKLEQAMTAGNWQKIGGKADWGSFDFVMTDPTRSNSGQVTLSLWAQSKGNDLNNPALNPLFATVKKSVYLPPRSTDILLQEFIARGPNDADVATVYESNALSRWQKDKPYQIYYLNPTTETVATAAIVKENVDKGEAKAAQQFISFLQEPEQQKIFVQHGFRPAVGKVDLQSVPNSPWSEQIPGSEINPPSNMVKPPDTQAIGEIQRLWERQ